MFLHALRENICRTTGLPSKCVRIVSGRLIITTNYESDAHIRTQLSMVFGISSFSPAILVKANYTEIENAVESSIVPSMELSATFAISATRGDKKFPMTSKEIEIKLGDFVRTKFGKKVDLENPGVTFYVEVFPGTLSVPSGNAKRSSGAVIYTEKLPGAGGLPVGTQPPVAALLSGGIDSPVAAYRIMKRGAPAIAVHFHSYPFTSRASIDKVKELAQILAPYGLRKLYLVPLGEAQKATVQKAAEKYRVLLYRRLMVRIAQEIAHREGAQALVTGESLGQVASQTMENMRAVEAVANMPIFRPLIGFDKEEIIAEAKKIGTFEISILPDADCCTLFMPKNPATRARISDIIQEEAKLDIENLVKLCLHSSSSEHQ